MMSASYSQLIKHKNVVIIINCVCVCVCRRRGEGKGWEVERKQLWQKY